MLAKIHFFPVILKLLIELSRAQKFIFPSDSQITVKLLRAHKKDYDLLWVCSLFALEN